MNLARASVSRPVLTAMMTLMVLVLGSVALTRLKIDLLPSIELPTLTIRTQYEGADPVVVGGLSVSAMITLGLIPVVYSLVHRERH